MSTITVLTNMKPTNVGNQALSTELLRLVQRLRPDAVVEAIGRTGGLQHLRPGRVEDVPRLLEEWTAELVTGARCGLAGEPLRAYAGELVPLARRSRVRLAVRGVTTALRLRARAKDLLQRLGVRSTGAQRQPARMARMARSEIVIYNPAGELNPHPGSFDVVLRSLVEVLAARRMGARTYIVNHSVECPDAFAEAVVVLVYRQMSGVIVREQRSRDELERLGVPSALITVVPDIAFLTPPPANVTQLAPADRVPDKQLVGLSINYWDAHDHEEGWVEFVAGLRRRGREVMFVSNALGQDVGFARQLSRRCGLRVQARDYDYQDYSALLSRLRVVVTNRLHTGVLAYVAGTPVVPVEANRFKVTSLFREIGYPLDAIAPGQAGWVAALTDAVERDLAREEALSPAHAQAVRQAISAGYAAILARG